jgi:hypothetical protein
LATLHERVFTHSFGSSEACLRQNGPYRHELSDEGPDYVINSSCSLHYLHFNKHITNPAYVMIPLFTFHSYFKTNTSTIWDDLLCQPQDTIMHCWRCGVIATSALDTKPASRCSCLLTAHAPHFSELLNSHNPLSSSIETTSYNKHQLNHT